MANRSLQIRGDPPMRRFLFSQTRANSEFDDHLDVVLETVDVLLNSYGIFHAKIHFSSGQLTLWSLKDPYNYQVYLKEEFLAPDFLGKFEFRRYPINASVPPGQIRSVLEMFRGLRHKDETIYMRSGSLNLINGLVELVFSCGASHYIDFREFLDHRDDIQRTSRAL